MPKKPHPLVSIVIPAAPNRKEDLIRCLESIKKSNYQNIEVILVNNSGDYSLESLARPLYPDVQIIEMGRNQALTGIVVGMANAKGDYVLEIDDDCTLNPDTLDIALDTFAKLPKNVMLLSALVYNPIINSYNESDLKNSHHNRFTFADGASMYRREMFEKIGHFYDKFFMWLQADDLAIRLKSKGFQMAYNPAFVINHFDKVNRRLRPIFCFYFLRNLAWMSVKHFSPVFYPILLFKHLITLIGITKRQGHPYTFFIGLWGYFHGWLHFYTPHADRTNPPLTLQLKFLKFYFTGKH